MNISNIFRIFLFLFLVNIHSSFAVRVTLFEHINFYGERYDVDVNRCSNVRWDRNDWASSLELPSGGCIRVFADECCQGESFQISSTARDFFPQGFNDKLTSLSPCNAYTSAYPSSMKETWLGHDQTVDKVYENGDVAIYFNSDMSRNYPWMTEYLTKLWAYVKKNYGDFGPEGGRLHPIFHANVQGDQYGFNSIQNYFDASSDCRNLIDVVSSSRDGWTRGATGVELDIITHEVSHIVEGASKGIHGSPTYRLWGDSKWAEIFIYDAYSGLGLTAERDRWFLQMQNSVDSYPREGTRWFVNWFYPIYKNYGGVSVLNNYFTLLAKYFPKEAGRSWRYQGEINIGEFVHFFSGAARFNLMCQAAIAFGWDPIKDEALYQKARQDFPEISKLYPY